jgi:hypothetical protein
MSGEIKSGWNLPPGVFDNDPHFNGDEPDVDVDELRSHIERMEEAIAALDEAASFLFDQNAITTKDRNGATDEAYAILDELTYIKSRLIDEGWNI